MKILFFDKLANGLDLSYEGFDALGEVIDMGVANTEAQLLDAAKKHGDAEVLLINKAPVTEAVMRAFKNLKYVGVFATGYNIVDIEAARKYGVTVCNAPGYSTEPVAQTVFGLILQIASNIGKYNTDCEKGKWVGYPVFSMLTYPMEELCGKTLGVFGYGSIGKRVAEIGKAFGMKVIVCTRTERPGCPFPYVSRDELLARSDYLSLNAPQNEGTKLFICEENIQKMKDGAVLINTARGGLVDEKALAEALKSGKLRAYGADVLTKEPMTPDCPLLGLPNCYLTPHVAWAHREARERLLNICLDNLKAFLAGKPINVV